MIPNLRKGNAETLYGGHPEHCGGEILNFECVEKLKVKGYLLSISWKFLPAKSITDIAVELLLMLPQEGKAV